MKILLYIIYIISGLPILLYPAVFIASIMSIAGEGEKTLLATVLLTLSIIYPAYIVLLIYLSHKHSSVALALLALLPGIVLFYILIGRDSIEGRQVYESAPREYVCEDQNTFLTSGGTGVGDYFVFSYAKKKQLFFFNKYNNHRFVTSTNDDNILIEDDETRNFLRNCKNKEGDSILDNYKEVSLEEWRTRRR